VYDRLKNIQIPDMPGYCLIPLTDTDERAGLNIDRILLSDQFPVSGSDNFLFPLGFYL